METAHPGGGVFVVDDDREVCRFIERVLARHGLRMRSLGCVNELGEALLQSIPAAIILDVALARSDAVDVLRVLAKEKYSGPVQLLSGRPAAVLGDINRLGLRRGLRMLPVLTKPLRLLQLDEALCAADLIARGSNPAALGLPGETMIDFSFRPIVDARQMRITSLRATARQREIGSGHVHAMRLSETDLVESNWLLAQVYDAALAAAKRENARRKVVCAASVGIDLDFLLGSGLSAVMSGREVEGRGGEPSVFVELSEAEVVTRPAETEEVANQLRLRGIGVVVSDAGASLLSQLSLAQLPISEVHLSSELASAGSKRSAVMFDIVHRSGGSVVVTGVETVEQARLLGHAGCDLCDGPIAQFLTRESPSMARPYLFPQFSKLDRRV